MSVTVLQPEYAVLPAPACAVGESPLWSVAGQCLWWVDIEGQLLYRLRPDAVQVDCWTSPERIGCVALHTGEQGGLIAAMETGLFAVVPLPGQPFAPRLLASISHGQAGMRCNDGRCDRAGRFWVSTMVRDMGLAAPQGVLYRLDDAPQELVLRPQLGGLITGNGLAFSPDGSLAYLSDSHPQVQQIWQFDVDGAGGLQNRRSFVDMRQYPGRPDGAAVDQDGCYWVCANDAGLLLRFTPDGVLDMQVRVPMDKPSMCAFGGARLDQLFVTSIRASAQPGAPPHALAGHTLCLELGIVGLPEQAFGAGLSPA